MPSNSLISLSFANCIKKICSISHMWRAIAKLMKVIPVAPISNKEVVLISFILPRLYATTRASSVNKLPGRLEAKINNGFSPPTATFVGIICFLLPHGRVAAAISLILTRANAESAFVRTNIGHHLFRHFSWWLPTSLQVKQQSSRCNLAIFS